MNEDKIIEKERKEIILKSDEVICDRCGGTGDAGDNKTPGAWRSWEPTCNKCFGSEKLTWIENIFGKDNPLNGLSGTSGVSGVSWSSGSYVTCGSSGSLGCAGTSGPLETTNNSNKQIFIPPKIPTEPFKNESFFRSITDKFFTTLNNITGINFNKTES